MATIKLKKKGERVFATPEQEKQVLEMEKKTAEKKKKKEPIKLEAPKKEEKGFVGKAVEAQEKILTSPKTTVALATTAAAGIAALAALPTAVALGTRVGSILHTASIHHWSRATGMLVAKKGITLASSPTFEKAARVGQSGVKKLFALSGAAASRVAVNTKTTALATSVLSRSFTTKALIFGGTWATAVFLGKWGQAEAPEALAIPLRDARWQAVQTGDWSTFDEYTEAARELADINTWEKILLWSPISPFIGVPMKIKGVKMGVELIAAIAKNDKIQQETGESDDEMWARIRQEEADQDTAAVDYYNEQRKLMVAWELEAKENQRNDDAAFWRREREKQRKKEAEDRQAIADFWIAYRKESQKEQEDLRPSNLNFGLL